MSDVATEPDDATRTLAFLPTPADPSTDLAGLSLIALCAVVLLIGMLLAIVYTLEAMTAPMDIKIFGYRPFHFLRVAVRNTVIHWCEVGIAHLEHWLTELFHGLAWAWGLQARALEALASAIERSLGLLRRSEIPGLIRQSIRPLRTSLAALQAEVTSLRRTVAGDVALLTRLIASEVAAGVAAAEAFTSAEVTRAETEIFVRLGAIEATLEGELQRGIGEVAAAERSVAARLAGLENDLQALGLPAALAALEALTIEVALLEAETGLDNPECRTKVRGICGIDPSAWENLLAGLALLGFGLSLRELVPPARAAVHALTDAERALA